MKWKLIILIAFICSISSCSLTTPWIPTGSVYIEKVERYSAHYSIYYLKDGNDRFRIMDTCNKWKVGEIVTITIK